VESRKGAIAWALREGVAARSDPLSMEDAKSSLDIRRGDHAVALAASR